MLLVPIPPEDVVACEFRSIGCELALGVEPLVLEALTSIELVEDDDLVGLSSFIGWKNDSICVAVSMLWL